MGNPGGPPPEADDVSEATRTFLRWRGGDPRALDQLLPLVYDELRRVAAAYLRNERDSHTLQPTALAHEAYLRLIDQRHVSWENRAHFLGLAAQAMRRILTDHARRRRAIKRGGGAVHVSIDDHEVAGVAGAVAVDDLDRALEDLARLDARQARVVELRYFSGLTIEETAEVIGVSPATAKRDWTLARAWLYRELRGSDS
jgi:RNA polymerase sigma factor (TIGR02999 family)